MPGENQSPAEPLDAESLGLQQNAFTALVLAFGRKGKDTSTADEEIKAAASNLTALAKALSARQEQDIKVTQHLSDAALWLTAGRFEETDMLLNRAVTLDINHAEWEPEQEALRLASAARTLAARGKLAELCNDLQAAVERFADARMVQPRADQAAMERYAALEATALAQIRQLTGMSEIDEITEVAAPAGAGGNRPPSRQDFRRHA